MAKTKAVAVPETAPEPPPADTPEPISQGAYALYKTPDGGLHLVYRPKGTTDAQHLEIPAFVVAMASKAAGGQDLGPLSVLLGEPR